jgi:hypothetical protein
MVSSEQRLARRSWRPADSSYFSSITNAPIFCETVSYYFQFEAALFATKNAAVIDRRYSAIAN